MTVELRAMPMVGLWVVRKADQKDVQLVALKVLLWVGKLAVQWGEMQVVARESKKAVS
jgi:hypothetical protein